MCVNLQYNEYYSLYATSKKLLADSGGQTLLFEIVRVPSVCDLNLNVYLSPSVSVIDVECSLSHTRLNRTLHQSLDSETMRMCTEWDVVKG